MKPTSTACIVFFPHINAALTAFVDTWNNHPISTEHNLTLNQLFMGGALEQNLISEMLHQSQQRMNHQLPAVTIHVEVPRNVYIVCISLRRELTSNVIHCNPLTTLDVTYIAM